MFLIYSNACTMHFTRHLFISLLDLLVLQVVTAYELELPLALNSKVFQDLTAANDATFPRFSSYNVDHVQIDARRNLLTRSSGIGCVWSDEPEQCYTNFTAQGEALFKSEDRFVQLLSSYPTCYGSFDEESCNAHRQCHWNNVSGSCIFTNSAYGHQKSPCVKAAPKFFEELEAYVICPKQKSSLSCSQTINCHWTEASGCVVDLFELYFDLDTNTLFSEGERVYTHMYTETFPPFFAQHDTASTSFDWSIALDWDPPRATCPPGTNLKVCQYEEAVVRTLGPVMMYCLGTYSSPVDCNNDPLCSYHAVRSSCENAAIFRSRAHANGVKALTQNIKSKTDADFISLRHSCPTISEESSCKGGCQWISAHQVCTLNMTSLNLALASPGATSARARSDPVCNLYSTFGLNDCRAAESAHLCTLNRLCYWTASIGCDLSASLLLASAVRQDQSLDLTIEELFPQCGRYTTKKQCKKANKARSSTRKKRSTRRRRPRNRD